MNDLDLKPKEQKALDYIKSYWEKWDKSPSRKELALSLGYVNEDSARGLVFELERKKYIKVMKIGRGRGLSISYHLTE